MFATSPKNSTYTKNNDFNPIDILREQWTKVQSTDLIFIGRDFTGTELGFLTGNENDLHFLPEGYKLDHQELDRLKQLW